MYSAAVALRVLGKEASVCTCGAVLACACLLVVFTVLTLVRLEPIRVSRINQSLWCRNISVMLWLRCVVSAAEQHDMQHAS
jgi:hypothetical protein